MNLIRVARKVVANPAARNPKPGAAAVLQDDAMQTALGWGYMLAPIDTLGHKRCGEGI